ncbi:MAG: type VI secretion system baseplate subunit TssG [Succinivibrio dextrinosolvens]|uniref:type VI secretion system baseplate subunit TssG n=1 Tax=Succinivibrio sp. TaxID=2053619 RepID=UPI0025D20876|nr:type VI secretion system baseplate subunit TssG [Succinivibrio sp.]MBQ9219817.1 type VI secretion system baseplate subunit TssG [Succinivibrio sp.]MDY6421381.1 type VI secretion system baseplate subunit TssG [Succinivibrio dextrinosolvens]MDY6465141.1 type VI secretion system baseplate subunit TssG [Succinivibrio dextrinosolvens]
MDTRERQVKQALRAMRNFGGVDFFEVVRDFEKASGSVPGIGYRKSSKCNVRFSQKPTLSGVLPAVTAISEDKNGNSVIEVSGPGLTGTDGPMPLEFTSRVLQLSNNYYDYALQRFIDIINNEFLSLYYRAYAQKDLAIGFDKKENNLPRSIFRAFSGAPADRDPELPKFAAETMMPFVISKNSGAEGLRTILREFFGFDIRIESNIFERYLIPEDLRCRLGHRDTCTLGVSMQIGKHFYSHTKKFDLKLGPMDFKDCYAMLPGTKNYNYLIEIINLYLQKPLDYDLIFILRKNSLKGIYLNGKYTLGSNCYFKYTNDKGECQIVINVSRLNGHAA